MPAARDPAATRSSPHPSPPAEVFWAEPPVRDVVLVRGRDAVRFLDGFQTAAVAKLGENRGTEAFFTDGRGHVLALANIFRPAGVSHETGASQKAGAPQVDVEAVACTPSGEHAAVWLDLPAGTAVGLVEHLEHYHIREDVEFTHVTPGGPPIVFVGGPNAAAWLAASDHSRFIGVLPCDPLELGAGSLGGVPVRLVRSDRYGVGGFELRAAAADVPRLIDWLSASGVPRVDTAVLEELRILGRHPEPCDIPPKTLPQELDRPAAISFTKGCYLGQETVARLDALGHVNRRLVVVAVDGDPPEPPAAVLGPDETPVGTITSACRSTRLGCGIGLALVHVKPLVAGVTISVAGRPARILTAAEPGQEAHA
jgi:folate-binding protein YgfZ